MMNKETTAINTKNPFKETEDRLQFAKALDRLKSAQSKNHATFTDFLNPQRCVVFLQQFTKMKVEAKAYGGHEDAERKIIGFAPPYPQTSHAEYYYSEDEDTPPQDEDPLSNDFFPITPLAITYNSQYSKQLTHRDFLGAVLGLGLDRCAIGDIRIGGSGAVMYVSEKIAGFIQESLVEVGRATVTATPHIELPDLKTTGISKRITAASLRVDAVISVALHLSRGKSAALIEGEKVFVNWANAKKTQQLSQGDIVTVRQVDRIRVDEIIGTTKKDRVALVITIY